MARHQGVRSPRRDPRVGRVGRARHADVRPAAGSRTDRPVRRLPWVPDFVRAGDDTFRRVTRRGRALGGGTVKRPESCPRVRREHERLLLPRLQRHQATLCFERGRRAKGAPRRSGAGRKGSPRATAMGGPAGRSPTDWRGSPASALSRSIPSWHTTATWVFLSRSRQHHPSAAHWTMLRSNFWTDFYEIPLRPL